MADIVAIRALGLVAWHRHRHEKLVDRYDFKPMIHASGESSNRNLAAVNDRRAIHLSGYCKRPVLR